MTFIMDVSQATPENPRQSKRLLPSMRSSFVFGLGALIAAGACTASSSEVAPPSSQFYYPTGLAVAPDDSVLFVANANADLRWDSGSVQVVDLALVDQMIATWAAYTGGDLPKDCARDSDHTETLICDEAQFIKSSAGARVGNFATDIAIQDTGAGTLRLIVPTRGDPSIAWIDYHDDALSCSKSNEADALCDDAHRLSYVNNDANLASIPEEPYAAYADSTGQFAVVTHLTSGSVTLVDSPIGGDAVVSDVKLGVFAADPLTGLVGSTGVAGKPNGAAGAIVYVGSRSEDRIQTFTVGRPVNAAPPFLLSGNYFFLDGVGNNAGGSSDTRRMAFSSTGNQLYLINRNPASLQIVDTTPDATGFPRNQTIASTDICRQSSSLVVTDTGEGERAYVSCFQDGQLYVVDPRGGASVENVIEIGRGPFAVAAAPSRKKIFVTNFLEDTIAVVDAEPGSKTHDRVVLRIGQVRPL